jgi:tetratricopeptide (TPR) repeat protein
MRICPSTWQPAIRPMISLRGFVRRRRTDAQIRLNPRLAVAYSNRGVVGLSNGAYDKALADFNEAIRLDAHDDAAYCNRGGAHISRGEFDAAIIDLDEAIRLQPRNAFAYANRSLAWDQKGEQEKAMADYRRADELDENRTRRRLRVPATLDGTAKGRTRRIDPE